MSAYLCNAGIRQAQEELEEAILDRLLPDDTSAPIGQDVLDAIHFGIQDAMPGILETLDGVIEDVESKAYREGMEETESTAAAELEETLERNPPVSCPACGGSLHEETGGLTCSVCRRWIVLSAR
jgi:hypothetical protein